MKIIVDGFPREVPENATVAGVLRALGESLKHALVEINGNYIHARDYEVTRIRPGDRMEVIYPAFGG